MAKRRRDLGTSDEDPATPRRHKRPRTQDLETLASNIRAFRHAAGWAQEELAHKASLARSHISALEDQRFDARLSTLGALADAFKCRTADLLTPSTPNARKKSVK